ncbi:MAG: septum formation protein Maf [Lachnospiraceae bacterium]|nr:septum formation protein Maf [Lachnospiraceae bacterium]
MKKIILASASPRRRELLELLHLPFTVVPAKGEEKTSANDPGEIVEHLARHKADEVFTLHKDALIIGADTIVYAEGEVLGKPKDRDDAIRMITTLQGNTHQVYTGVCLKYTDEAGNVRENCFHEKTDVTVYPMTDEEICAYADTEDPYDKAGGYGIQSGFTRYVRKIDGDYFTVMGLPVARLYHELPSFTS